MNLYTWTLISYEKLNRFQWSAQQCCYVLFFKYFSTNRKKPFLRTGTTFAFFHSEGNIPLSRQDLKIRSKCGKTKSLHNFSIRILIMTCPRSRFSIILALLFPALRRKWSFPLRISSVNIKKSALSCGFGYI